VPLVCFYSVEKSGHAARVVYDNPVRRWNRFTWVLMFFIRVWENAIQCSIYHFRRMIVECLCHLTNVIIHVVKFPSLLSFCVCCLISVMILITGMCNVKHFLKTGKGWHEIQDNRDDSVKTVAVFQSTDWCSPYLVTLGLIHLEPTHPEKPQCFSFPMSHICCIIQSKRWRHVVNHVRYASSLLLWWPFLTTVLAENVIQNTLMICLILIRWGYNP